MQFVQFFYYKTANRTAPCGVVRCGYAILQAVLVRFVRFPILIISTLTQKYIHQRPKTSNFSNFFFGHGGTTENG